MTNTDHSLSLDGPDPEAIKHVASFTKATGKTAQVVADTGGMLGIASDNAALLGKFGTVASKAALPVMIAATTVQIGYDIHEKDYKGATQAAGGAAGAVGGSMLGAEAGAAAGAALGSVVPVVGTVVGGAAGGLLGGFAGGITGYYNGRLITGSAWDGGIHSFVAGIFNHAAHGDAPPAATPEKLRAVAPAPAPGS